MWSLHFSGRDLQFAVAGSKRTRTYLYQDPLSLFQSDVRRSTVTRSKGSSMSTLTRGTLTRPFSTNATTSLRPTLAGTVPSHRCYILLHTSCPPSRYNARVSSAVQRALQLKLLKLGAIVNFSWSPDQPVCPQEGAEAYYSTAFSTTRGRLEIPEVSIHNVDEVGEQLRNHIEGPSSSIQNKPDSDVHLYVCTHGARDCRCGNMGGMVVNALRKEVEKRNRENPLGPSRRLKVAEVGHVGGHKCVSKFCPESMPS